MMETHRALVGSDHRFLFALVKVISIMVGGAGRGVGEIGGFFHLV
jgi:hypothetical protein